MRPVCNPKTYLFLKSLLICLWGVSAFICSNEGRAEESKQQALTNYEKHIKPLLEKRCFACHGALKQESSLRLDSGKMLLEGGDAGAAVVPGDLEESWLYQTVTGEAGFLMPPEGHPLTKEEISLIKKWIEAGAPFPEDEQPEENPENHWAFQKIKRPALPVVKNKEWLDSPIDAFVAAKHAEYGLTPQPETDRATLLRRVYIDLIGLPPTREELHAFLNDSSPEAYSKVVTKLLDSPQYGERWGRHWMDVWRYSDWYGRRGAKDMTNSYSLIWRWRDWIVKSLNADIGYDKMIEDMVAADELHPSDAESHIATGFIVRNYYRWNYHTWLKDNVEHTGKAFLGLTMNCCECHDHKYDPISQNEYFAFRAFFEQLDLRHDRVPGEADPGPFPEYKLSVLNGPIRTGRIRVFDRFLDKETRFYTGGVAANVVKDKEPIAAAAPAFLKGDELKIARIDLPTRTWYPGLKFFVIEEEITKRDSATKLAYHYWKTDEPKLQKQIAGMETKLALLEKSPIQQDEVETEPVALVSTSNHQALKMIANQGRRILQHGLPEWSRFDKHTMLSFRIRILEDGFSSFQLSEDFAMGRTNMYIVFAAGEIQAYIPGKGTHPQIIGKYDATRELNHFRADVVFNPELDQALLSIVDLEKPKLVVDKTAIALHGWRPQKSDNRGVFIEVQPGTVVEYDDIVFKQSDSNEELLNLNFESACYMAGHDASGLEQWQVSKFSRGDATSEVVFLGGLSEAQKKWRERISASYQELENVRLQLETLEAKYIAAKQELDSFQIIVDVEKQRYLDDSKNLDEEKLMVKASLAERTSKLASAKSKYKMARSALFTTKNLPAGQQNRVQKIKAAEGTLRAAHAAVAKAIEAVGKESTEYTAIGRQFPKQTTGKRAALAKWLSSRENPLTARVAVNHIWGHHFGQPIVGSTYNFGRSGDKPTHLELLNWLAAELQDNNWSMKHIHQLIVSSRAYRQSSRSGPENIANKEADRDNKYLWRFPGYRMEAEVVRDSVLHVAEVLDSSLYGQEIEHDQGLISNRRSIYFSHHGEGKMKFLELFDAADTSDCYIRKTSIMPQQALALSNSELTIQKGRLLARLIWTEVADSQLSRQQQTESFITQAFERILSRKPHSNEVLASHRFLTRQSELFTEVQLTPATAITETVEKEVIDKETKTNKEEVKKNSGSIPAVDPVARSRESFIQALFNHNDFVTVR